MDKMCSTEFSKEKIIVALDVDNLKAAEKLIREVGPFVGGFKVGLELLTACGAPNVVASLNKLGTRLFFDGKFKDIPNTVASASREVTKLGVWMFNVHAMGGRKMMEASVTALRKAVTEYGMPRPIVLAVTILTSFDVAGLKEIGVKVSNDDDLKEQVVRLALLAKASGLDGVVASPKEISLIRKACGPDFKIVTPGVRPSWATANDQKRVMTPLEAINEGADYLVVGRPITKPPPEIGSPAEAVRRLME